MKVNDVIGKKHERLKGLSSLGEGGFSTIYAVEEDTDIVLKWSYISYDGFRMLAELSPKKRLSFNFRKILDKKRSGDDIFYLLENLYPLDWTEEDKAELLMINNGLIFDISNSSERIKFIVQSVENLKKAIPNDVNYLLDINEENIMVNKDGQIFLTDPVSELI